MTKTALELWDLLSQMPQETEQNPIAKNAPLVKIKTGKAFKRIEPYWPELPMGRTDIDHVSYLLDDWIDWASSSPPPEENNLFKNSVIHTIECAIILELSPYVANRGFGRNSEMFSNSVELAHYLDGYNCFQRGYWVELAKALDTCFALEEPWGISPEWVRKYSETLIYQLKDLALYHAEYSLFWMEKFKGGRKKGAMSAHKQYVKEKVKNRLDESRKTLWGYVVSEVKKETDLCPLYHDDATDKIYLESNHTEYVFERFKKDCSEFANLQKKSPQKK